MIVGPTCPAYAKGGVGQIEVHIHSQTGVHMNLKIRKYVLEYTCPMNRLDIGVESHVLGIIAIFVKKVIKLCRNVPIT